MIIHHVGIVCNDIETSVRKYSKMYNVLNQSEVVYDSLQQAYLCLLITDTGLNVEFISGPQVQNLVKKRTTYYHLCYSVDDLESSIAKFEEEGAIIVSSPKPAVLFNNKKVAFLYTQFGLVELLEK